MDTPDFPPDQIAEAIHLSGSTVKTEGVAGYDFVTAWDRKRSGTRFYRFRIDPTGDQVLVKAGLDWSGSDARDLADASMRLANAINTAEITSAGAIEPLGWVESPPLVVMPYVPGTDLVSLLRQPDRPDWDSMTDWIHTAGSMLAVYHRANPIKRTVDSQRMLEEARDAAKRMRIREGEVEAAIRHIDVQWSAVCLYGDFGPGNLIGASDGNVYLIDPPVHPEIGLLHRDLGNFLFEMRRQLAGHGYTRTKRVRGKFARLRDALLDGYVESSDLRHLTGGDRALIALFEMRRSAGMARKRFPRRPGDLVWFTGSALARRRDVRRLAGQLE